MTDPTDAVRAMTDPTDAVRAAIRSLADEGRPVDLGGRALARLHRRRRRRSLAAGLGVVLVVAAAVAWPQWFLRDRGSPPLTQSTPTPTSTAVAWPPFTGLGRVPAAAGGSAPDRLLVAAYGTGSAGRTYVLDPLAGEYRPIDADHVLAVSPDLRFAVVLREHAVNTAAGGPLVRSEFGVLGTSAGRVLGRLEVGAWNDPRTGYVISEASWSPDGARLALSVRHGVAGRGWQAERLLFVDTLTGAVRTADIEPSDGLEPLGLIGWTTDSRAVVLTADRIGTDQASGGHVVFDEAGRPIVAVHWPKQADAVMVTDRDELGLVSVDGDLAMLVSVRTGTVHRQYAGALLAGRGNLLAWRDGEAVVQAEEGGASGCIGGSQIVGIAVDTGQSRVLQKLDEPQRVAVVAPANGLARLGTAPAW